MAAAADAEARRGAGITVDGPFNPTGNPVDTASRTRIFVCRAPDPKEETACASRILSNLARKAFRRPVTDKDLAPLMQFYNEGRKAGTFEGGIENATGRDAVEREVPVSRRAAAGRARSPAASTG